jgi:hypothetical protein
MREGIPRVPAPVDALARLPRTRGGHPTCSAISIMAQASSPHARESSPSRLPGGLAIVVLPVPAGSSHRGRRTVLHAGVLPVPAAVIPPPGDNGVFGGIFPHARGHPIIVAFDEIAYMSSPHTPESSRPRRPVPHRRSVFPARAGVIPRWTARSRRGRCLPRGRGGHPGTPTTGRSTAGLPRTRGGHPAFRLTL